MKISHKLTAIVLLLALLGGLYLLMQRDAQSKNLRWMEFDRHLDLIELTAYRISLLTHEIMLHPYEERAHRQWLEQSAKLSGLLNDARLTSAQEVALLRASYDQLVHYYERLTLARSNEKSTPLFRSRQEHIASSLIGSAQEMAAYSSRLRASAYQHQQETVMRLNQISFTITLLATLLLVGLALALLRGTTRALSLLHAGIERATQGNLETRVQLHTHDELQEFAEGFNHMLAKLNESMASRDALNREVEAHQRVEQELRHYRDELELRVEERTAELGKSRLAAISIMEDANRLRSFAEQAHKEAERVNKELAAEVVARKKSEQALRDNQVRLQHAIVTADSANQAKSQFLANMSHELRTPLNAILGFSELMARDSELPSAHQKNLSIINRSGAHLLSMINDVLDLSKIDAGSMALEPEPFDLYDLLTDLEQMIRLRADGRGLQFTVELDARLERYLIADTGKLRQILINLLGNAIKFTKQGGIALRARTLPRTAPAGHTSLQLEVEDSGDGIPADKLEAIFTPFVQAGHSAQPEPGTGLGLAISNALCELMQGTLQVESTLGKGSLFILDIPVEIATKEALISEQRQPPQVVGLVPGQPDWRILVVEDNIENRALLTTLLGQVGFVVREAENGLHALELFRQWHPQLIWMDMCMAVMDGYTATRKIRAMPGGDQVRILAITASAYREQKEKILQAGCDEVIRKPYRPHEIFTAMQRQLGVDYEFAESEPEVAAEVELPAQEAICALPAELRGALLSAASQLDEEQLEQLLNEVGVAAPELREEIAVLVWDFRFETLIDLLKVCP